TRDFLYVGDIVRANLLAAKTDQANGASFNIAGGKAISLNKLTAVLQKVIGSDLAPKYSEERPGDIRHSHASISRAESILGFQPKFTLEAGLARTVEYYRSNSASGQLHGSM